MRFGYRLLAAAPSPSPSPGENVPDASEVSPGLAGFVTIFLLALALIVLIMSMNKRIRRVRLRDHADPQEGMHFDAPGEGPDGSDGRPDDSDDGFGERQRRRPDDSDGPET